MRFYEDIVIDPTIKNIKKLMKSKFAMLDYYAICVSPKGNGLMEILSLSQALSKANTYKDYGAIAIIKGQSSAKKLSMNFIENWIKNHGDFNDFRNYYNSRCYVLN